MLRCGKPNGRRAGGQRRLEHDPEKWKPVFGEDHAQTKKLDFDPIQLNWIGV
jgi:hypothetical protein